MTTYFIIHTLSFIIILGWLSSVTVIKYDRSTIIAGGGLLLIAPLAVAYIFGKFLGKHFKF